MGSNAVILMGAHIGACSVIAAGAVVLEGSRFPPFSLIAGVPAVRKGDIRWKNEAECSIYQSAESTTIDASIEPNPLHNDCDRDPDR